MEAEPPCELATPEGGGGAGVRNCEAWQMSKRYVVNKDVTCTVELAPHKDINFGGAAH
jgi:hypothetical protein